MNVDASAAAEPERALSEVWRILCETALHQLGRISGRETDGLTRRRDARNKRAGCGALVAYPERANDHFLLLCKPVPHSTRRLQPGLSGFHGI